MRQALDNLAAEPSEQVRRLRGMVVRDELALDFDNGYRALSLLSPKFRLESDVMEDLAALRQELFPPADDPLWVEDLNSARWTRIRDMANRLLPRV